MNMQNLLKQSQDIIDGQSTNEDLYRLKRQVTALTNSSHIDEIQQKLVNSYKNMTNAIDRCEEFGTIRHTADAQRAAKNLHAAASTDMVKSTQDTMSSLFDHIHQDGFKDSASYYNATNAVIKNVSHIAAQAQDVTMQSSLNALAQKYHKVHETIACFKNIHEDNMQDAKKLRMIMAPIALPIILDAQKSRMPQLNIKIKPAQG